MKASRLSLEVFSLLKKDLLLEWRNRYAFNSMLLYVFSTIFTTYISFSVRIGDKEPITWNVVFWIILLFAAINSTSKAFAQEKEGRSFFYWQVVSPEAIILSKILFNIIIMTLVAVIGITMYSVVMGNPVKDMGLFLINLGLGAIGFATSLTLISAISAKASNSSAMMPILGFPVLLPMIMMLIRVSKNAMDELAFSRSSDTLLTLLALNVIVSALSYVLFPYLWKN